MPHTRTVSVYILITNVTYPDSFGLHTDYKCHIPRRFRFIHWLQMPHTHDSFGLHTDYKCHIPWRFRFTYWLQMPHTRTVSVYILITNATYLDGFCLHTDYKCHIPGRFQFTYWLQMRHTRTVSVYIPITNATYPDGFSFADPDWPCHTAALEVVECLWHGQEASLGHRSESYSRTRPVKLVPVVIWCVKDPHQGFLFVLCKMTNNTQLSQHMFHYFLIIYPVFIFRFVILLYFFYNNVHFQVTIITREQNIKLQSVFCAK